eukprot:5924-Chlamydomonas_euryale.AAC.3
MVRGTRPAWRRRLASETPGNAEDQLESCPRRFQQFPDGPWGSVNANGNWRPSFVIPGNLRPNGNSPTGRAHATAEVHIKLRGTAERPPAGRCQRGFAARLDPAVGRKGSLGAGLRVGHGEALDVPIRVDV